MGAFLDSYFLFFSISSFCSASFTFALSCQLWRKFYHIEMHKPGDVVLGGLFEVHYSSVFPEWTFTSQPQQPSCKG